MVLILAGDSTINSFFIVLLYAFSRFYAFQLTGLFFALSSKFMIFGKKLFLFLLKFTAKIFRATLGRSRALIGEI